MINSERAGQQTPRRSSLWLGILPFIGVILFLISTVLLFLGGAPADWRRTLLSDAVHYLIGWAGVGAGISHIFFGRAISRSIGFERSSFQREVGFANLAFGIAGLLAPQFGNEFWLAVIVMSSIFRVLCGIGHIVEMVTARNFAINNTAILVIDFVVPGFLIWAYFAWA